MSSEYSHRLGALIADWDPMSLGSEAEGHSGDDDEPDEAFETGLQVGMKLVQAQALSKYAGKSLTVFKARQGNRGDTMFYFVAVDEDELAARLADCDPG